MESIKCHRFTKTRKPLHPQRFSCFCFIDGAQDKTRTCPAERPLPPQSSVYTNLTIWSNPLRFRSFYKSSETVNFKVGARNRTRTYTAVKPLVPETSVYTNFTTWAIKCCPTRIRTWTDRTKTCCAAITQWDNH